MTRIELKQPTCFYSQKEPLNIFDEKGILFYSSNFVENFSGFFSLPKGIYFVDGDMRKTNRKLNHYEKIRLPLRERDYKHNWNDFKILFEVNPNKCTIDHKQKTIVYDKSFVDKPFFILAFILFHEMGHNYYSNEFKADLYAVKHMLKNGFNASQIGLCPLVSLSENNYDRKEKIIETILKLHTS